LPHVCIIQRRCVLGLISTSDILQDVDWLREHCLEKKIMDSDEHAIMMSKRKVTVILLLFTRDGHIQCKS
jgi:hypothetical protein